MSDEKTEALIRIAAEEAPTDVARGLGIDHQ